jgi:hypothetical protein
MLDAIPGKDVKRAVIHLDGNGHSQLSLRVTQDSVNARIQAKPLGYVVEQGQYSSPQAFARRSALKRQEGMSLDKRLSRIIFQYLLSLHCASLNWG